MQNSVLFRRSSFFADAINVVFYVDLFFYHELSTRMKSDDFLSTVFSDKLPVFKGNNRAELDKLIIKSTVNKINQNILLDWISKDKFSKTDINISLEEYVARLYMDMLVNPICDEYLQTTEFGNTLKLLSRDRQTNEIVIYIPFESNFIQDAIGEIATNGASNTHVKILSGSKSKYLKENRFDSYIFENVTDIDECLAIPENKVNPNSKFIKEVIIPTYEFNMEEGRTDFDMLVEQVTYHKLKLKKTPNEYMSEFNLSINTISVPF